MLCRFLVQVVERFHDDVNVDPSIVREGATLRLGYEEYPRLEREDIPIGFPALPDPVSAARFVLLRTWLEWCNTTHACNQQDVRSQGASPTRLIYVGHADAEVLHLYLPKGTKGVKYTALSHCWGNEPPSEGDPRYCTTDGNISARLNRFSLSELPKTFQDAVRVTRELGIEYLWIDSLCIIQWNAEDWECEAGRMEDVFASAYCTIAATSAVDSNAGFLTRNISTEYVRVQDAAGNQVYICSHIDDFEKDVEQARLNKRAWVMQERVLAKRTIHFSADQTYWECGEGVYYTPVFSSQRKVYFSLDPSFPDRLLKSGKERTVEFIHFLFENYSKRGLTKDTDRCVAVSGLEARIARALECNSRHGIFQKHLHRNLLWQASNREMERIAYDNDQHIPSWSWMACSGGIRFMEVEIGSVSWADELAFDDERDSAALNADVGKFRKCTLKPGGDRYTISNFFGGKRGWVHYDVKSGRREHEELCVVVGRAEEKASKDHYYILVVVPTGEDGEYKRVGVGMVRTRCVEKLRAHVRIV
ncbi:HET domain containing protein [Pyrenophora tritici-repentis]|uniref:HET domain containing protein n=1 Tax=Pyrenophora tritici-repentis TaxID=45151 RepID=A0A834RSQ2_9PLEO|nr:HET domain containing protein [Pyrenophora tritici-repentis]